MKPAIRTYSFDALDVRVAPATALPGRASVPAERINPRDDRSKLERNHPAITRSIALLWGYPEMNEYFDKLWQGEARAEAIDPEAMADLMLLARVHQELLPARPKAGQGTIYGSAYGAQPVKQDVWGSAPRVR
jgi:hypothetical protein